MKHNKLAEQQPLLDCRADFNGGFRVSGRGLSRVSRNRWWYFLLLGLAATSLTIRLNFKANVQGEGDVELDIGGALPTLPVE